jgi:uncharacterized protein
MTAAPRFRELSRDEALAVLSANHVGRIAFSLHERVEIVPIHYVHADGWIFGRTSHGRKLENLTARWWVAFETDAIDGLFDWRSVVVHGGFYLLEPDSGLHDAELYAHAIAALRTILPATLTDADPVPDRTLVFGIAVQEITGRAAESRSAAPQGATAR